MSNEPTTLTTLEKLNILLQNILINKEKTQQIQKELQKTLDNIEKDTHNIKLLLKQL